MSIHWRNEFITSDKELDDVYVFIMFTDQLKIQNEYYVNGNLGDSNTPESPVKIQF